MAQQNDFFDDTQNQMNDQDQNDLSEVIKLGDEEYTPQELQKLVGLGKIGQELEERWNTKIDRVYPEFTKTRQELEELRKEREILSRNQIAQQPTQEQVSQEEIKRQALQQASELGLVSREEANQIIRDTLAGYRLLDQTSSLVSQKTQDGYPQTSAEDLLQFMNERGISNPEDAYDIMFKPQIRKIDEEKIRSLKPQGIYTEQASQAGGKIPEPLNLKGASMDKLTDAVMSTLRGGGQ